MAQGLRSFIPPTLSCLEPEDVKVMGEHPIGAGGVSNIWGAIHNGCMVVVKSYRLYEVSDVAEIVAKFTNEIHIYNLLYYGGVDVVPLVGIYSSEAHPFSLVYEYMINLDLRQYLMNVPNVRGLELLTAIARSLKCMHDLNVVHGDLRTANILVDKVGTAHIAGFSNASILSGATLLLPRSGTRTGALHHSSISKLVLPQPAGVPNYSPCTKADDMFAFGIIAWEVLTGRPPFPEMVGIAATYALLSGAKLPRPNRHDIPDKVWYMIKRCLYSVPSKRMSAGEAVNLLETVA